MTGAAPAGGPIGRRLARADARRLAAGRGRYTDDIALPRMVFAAFLRSPHAHARIRGIDAGGAAALAGVLRVVSGAEVAARCTPWRVTNRLFPEMRAPVQHAMAVERACYQGEPVAAVLAATRAVAEDAVEQIEIDWEPLPAVTDPVAALAGGPLVHPDLGTNRCYRLAVEEGDPGARLAAADVVVEETFVFARHTGVPLETRTVLADYDPAGDSLTVYQSHQAPHEMQGIYAERLGIPEHRVRVVCPDVGGAFGIKLQACGDELAVCALARIAGRPVKYQADRTEALLGDVQARDHRVRARMGVSRAGAVEALEVRDVFAIGPYPQLPRGTLQEGMHVVQLTGAPYRFDAYRAELDVVYQNKGMCGLYRAVGQPIACAVAERLIDLAAERLGRDPSELRLAAYWGEDALPRRIASGVRLDALRFRRAHAALTGGLGGVGWTALRAEQAALRARGIYRGLGLGAFVELVDPGPGYYARAGVRVSTQDACTVRLEPSGHVRCAVSITELGQGSRTAVAQVVAAVMGIGVDAVEVTSGDSRDTPYGAGAWASRGAMMGTRVAWDAAANLRGQVLELAGRILQAPPGALAIRDGWICAAADASPRLALAEAARLAHFGHSDLPPGFQPELTATVHRVTPSPDPVASNGIHGSYLEVDSETGFVRLLAHAVAHDHGTAINPLLVEEQLRGGVAQGIGAALLEECLYDAEGQHLNATLAEYLVPMAPDVPDIAVIPIEPPAELPAGVRPAPKGVGEAGVAGASAAVLNAVNDAIRPLGARIARLPCTPERVLAAIAAARRG